MSNHLERYTEFLLRPENQPKEIQIITIEATLTNKQANDRKPPENDKVCKDLINNLKALRKRKVREMTSSDFRILHAVNYFVQVLCNVVPPFHDVTPEKETE